MDVGIKLNDEIALKYSVLAGKLLTNFGHVEFLTVEWALKLSFNKLDLGKLYNMNLYQRIKLVVSLINESEFLTSKNKADVIDVWRKLNSEGREKRNAIAHAPFIIRTNSDTNGKEVVVAAGFLTYNKKTKTEELISEDELKNCVDATAVLVQKLDAYKNSIFFSTP